ncbi:putative phospholipase B-like lamina ancestor isoform X1 [Hylaeus volcanicus]|uniref:putative phospholipase B-like lamina ancestor isoform X1 n=1 Tax=Hylaeus volcanicus TaxID=313075 RepID=UPI0023B8663B|nr:putative phospholipase B-like lamina ancestor isoform X1 [Hylaeus volcanicus]XP_053986952.1 putative phospholipase B-like lamina ancestor isoform X1 [Hylaeus volcanicus]
MLKVVGASWLQTRISTYILIAVALLGIGAIILGEFGHSVEQDGTYSATVSWNHKGGYRIEFWGQGNDLAAVAMHAARAYYKTGIFENGWSYIEIETSSKYPDTVQAYAAGLLEGSLTWQLIHHHWYNTIRTECEAKPVECRKLRRYLRDNTAVIRERAELLESTDPFWHMVRLFYTQLDGLEAGWKFAVRRSRVSVSMESEDFLWLALASDVPGFQQVFNISDIPMSSMIYFKSLPRDDSEPLIAIGHNTAAPYTKMLRLVKKYTFGYHVLPLLKTSALTPSRSIVMSSYPGALSSADEFYFIRGENRELIVTGTSLLATNRSEWSFLHPKDHVMLSVRLMTANRLATNGQSWFDNISHQNGGASALQWIVFEPRSTTMLLVEQLPSVTVAMNYTEEFKKAGYISYLGTSNFQNINDIVRPAKKDISSWRARLSRLQDNVTTFDQFRNMMRGCSQEDCTAENQNSKFDPLQELTYRGDLEDEPLPYGIIDTKILAIDADALETFETTSGPATSQSRTPFKWSERFPNISHIGHPDTFNFESVTPKWVWV